MSTLKISELQNYINNPFLLGAFLSRLKEDDRGFYTYSRFLKTKKCTNFRTSFINFANDFKESCNNASQLNNKWEVHTVEETVIEVRLYIENDKSIKLLDFYNKLYSIFIKSDLVKNSDSDTLSDDKKWFLRGYFELCGSVDNSRNFLPTDLNIPSGVEPKKIFMLPHLMGISTGYFNLNFRDLQPQGNKRKNQIRINLEYYAKEIGFLNKFKAARFESSNSFNKKTASNGIFTYEIELKPQKLFSQNYFNALDFYMKTLLSKTLTLDEKKQLKKMQGKEASQNKDNSKNRSTALRNSFNIKTENKCARCDTKETFINKNTNIHHFEIHHFISMKNRNDLDQLDNFVKLCPTCHVSLKKNIGLKDDQLRTIKKILEQNTTIRNFCSKYYNTNKIDSLTKKVQNDLG